MVWNDGCSIAKEVATSAAKMAMTDWNFIGCWRESTYRSNGVVGEKNVNTFQRLAVKSRPLAASSTNAPSNSVAFTKAAAELGMIAREYHRLSLKTEDRNLIREASAS